MDTQLSEPTYQTLIKFSKVAQQTNEKSQIKKNWDQYDLQSNVPSLFDEKQNCRTDKVSAYQLFNLLETLRQIFYLFINL